MNNFMFPKREHRGFNTKGLILILETLEQSLYVFLITVY